MSTDPRSVQEALHEDASVPGNFNPQNGKWESPTDTSRTKLVFDRDTKKLVAMTPQQAAANAARKADKFVGVDMARSGFF
jgi:hypothetical protein